MPAVWVHKPVKQVVRAAARHARRVFEDARNQFRIEHAELFVIERLLIAVKIEADHPAAGCRNFRCVGIELVFLCLLRCIQRVERLRRLHGVAQIFPALHKQGFQLVFQRQHVALTPRMRRADRCALLADLQLDVRKVRVFHAGQQRRLRFIDLRFHRDEGLHHVVAVAPFVYPGDGHAFIAFRALRRLKRHLVVPIHGNAHLIADHDAFHRKLHAHRTRFQRAAARIGKQEHEHHRHRDEHERKQHIKFPCKAYFSAPCHVSSGLP